ncbi:endonuclease I family protein [Acholeplasma hippikon]|uniref:Extracellular ribonuclease n=1 Tax=Acholeplasma hippikon TaxID=264636 RepID=A0A449BJN8_9MOLU|nr:endonuclease [Acholeplasma hippikon]VEU82681.1 Extracellular ribonuclease precursor [Acholeplasma hippikon]
MAKSKKKQVKKVVKKYKKLSTPLKFLVIVLLLAIVGAGVYLYANGYLDEFLYPPVVDTEDPGTNPGTDPEEGYSAKQNAEGYYYYTEAGFGTGEYYYDAKNKTGDELIISLRTIVNTNFNPISYGDARYVLSYSDRITKDGETYVYGMYDGDKIATEWIGSGAGAWQREHVWPNSKLGIPRVENSSKNQGSDVHNLRAITGINQTRSNRYFTAGSGAAKTVGSEAFYPGDEFKGDVARILFYMVIKYDFLTLTDDESKLINDPNTNYTLSGAYSGLLSLLIEWHKEDPVDEFEIQRNEFIYSGIAFNPSGKAINPQGNRNPFIDKPELAHLIFENKTIEELKEPVVETASSIDFMEFKPVSFVMVAEINILNKKSYALFA